MCKYWLSIVYADYGDFWFHTFVRRLPYCLVHVVGYCMHDFDRKQPSAQVNMAGCLQFSPIPSNIKHHIGIKFPCDLNRCCYSHLLLFVCLLAKWTHHLYIRYFDFQPFLLFNLLFIIIYKNINNFYWFYSFFLQSFLKRLSDFNDSLTLIIYILIFPIFK